MRFDLAPELAEITVAVGGLAAPIPEELGGAGRDLTAASVILEEINASGCNYDFLWVDSKAERVGDDPTRPEGSPG